MEYRGFNYVLPKGMTEEKMLLKLKQDYLKGLKLSQMCQVVDAQKRGYVTVLTRSRGVWNGKTYTKNILVTTYKGGF